LALLCHDFSVRTAVRLGSSLNGLRRATKPSSAADRAAFCSFLRLENALRAVDTAGFSREASSGQMNDHGMGDFVIVPGFASVSISISTPAFSLALVSSSSFLNAATFALAIKTLPFALSMAAFSRSQLSPA
jgi:hypothetical protein